GKRIPDRENETPDQESGIPDQESGIPDRESETPDQQTWLSGLLDVKPLLVDAQIDNDMNLRLQYIAGLGLNSMAFQRIYRTSLSYRKFPEGLFLGYTGRMDALRTLLRATFVKTTTSTPAG